jgi:hypothetical protein
MIKRSWIFDSQWPGHQAFLLGDIVDYAIHRFGRAGSVEFSGKAKNQQIVDAIPFISAGP